jgi:ubiquinone/menaquinone biosynthesis C-methylase UbiE
MSVDTETLARSRLGRVWVRVLAKGMESRLRYRLFPPAAILRAAELRPGQTVLEVGCGTGYFTIPAARLIGDFGSLTALDVLQESVDMVAEKVGAADLGNVRVLRRDAMATGLEGGSFDIVLLFGEIPAPMLPLARLLPEMHRVLRAHGRLAVWPPVPGWLPGAVLRSGLFALAGKRHGVYGFVRR